MTAIVGLARAGRVYMGGDSAMTTDHGEQWLCASPKVWRAGSYVFGAAGDADYIELAKIALARQPESPDEVPALIAKTQGERGSEATAVRVEQREIVVEIVQQRIRLLGALVPDEGGHQSR